MKTLAQVEPRIDIATVPGNADVEHDITLPGSYYLTSNLNVTKSIGIRANASGVTIDLNGFAVLRSTSAALTAILLTGPAGCTVKNGYIAGGFDSGIQASSTQGFCRSLTLRFIAGRGISVSDGWVLDGCKVYESGSGPTGGGIFAGTGSTLNNCTATAMGGIAGISVGAKSTLTNCSVTGMAGSPGAVGLDVGLGSIVTNCSATSNTVAFGIRTQGETVLRDCLARANTSGEALSAGIAALGPSTITGCNSSSNLNSLSNSGHGIYAPNSSSIQNCIVALNKGNGIEAGSGSTITGCTAKNNGAGSFGFGILVVDDATVSNSTVQGNRNHGVSAGQRCKIDHVNANGNGNVNGSGISTNIRAMVKNCSAVDNGKNGIVVGGESIVADCRASHNGLTEAGAGIDSSGGSGSRIEGNQVRDNTGIGILGSTSDIIIRNSAGNNSSLNYSPSTGANFGPLQSPNATSNPTANIAF